MKPGRRRLLIPGLLVALLVVVAVAAGVRRADADPTPVPVVPNTRVSVIDDPRITESSGLAASQAHRGLAYTINDSGHEPRVFAVDIASGRVVGVTSVSGVRWKDTEAMALWDGKLWVADVGNNEFSRTDAAIYGFDEPGPGNHQVTATRYPVVLEGPPADVESMAIIPGRIDLYAKSWPAGYALELVGQLRANEPNIARVTQRHVPAFSSDATVTPDGRYVLVRNSALVEVRDVPSWQVVHRDATPVMSRGETITVEPSGRSYLIGSEGGGSPLVRIAFDPSTWPGQPIPDIDVRTQTEDQQPVRLFVWEHRKALGVAALVLALGTMALLVAWLRARRRRRTGNGRKWMGMGTDERPTIVALGPDRPRIADGAWVAPTATLVGAVEIAEGASIWYGAVLRGDNEPIVIGPNSNVQDNVVFHTDDGIPVSIGEGVSVGHNAVVHGATVGDHVLVGMGAILMNRSVIGDECLIAAGALVPEGSVIPPRSLVVGVPAKVLRELSDDEVAGLHRNARVYTEHRDRHRDATDVQ